MSRQQIIPFKNKKVSDPRARIDTLQLLGRLNDNLEALSKIDQELEDAITDFERDIMDDEGNVIRTEYYKSTTLDKETIAVYHTRQNGRKIQIDTIMKMLNKVMPDLKAIEQTSDLTDKATAALRAFAAAAAED